MLKQINKKATHLTVEQFLTYKQGMFQKFSGVTLQKHLIAHKELKAP